MSKITYIDKNNVQTSGLPAQNKVADVDMNEIKNVVNTNDDLRIALQSQLDSLENRAGAVPYTYTFDSSTVEADPSNGNFRLDFALPAGSGEAYISKTDKTLDAGLVLTNLVAGDYLYFQSRDIQKQGILTQVATVTDNTSWVKVTYAVADSAGDPFTDGELFQILAIPQNLAGTVGNLQQVTNNGSVTTNEIEVNSVKINTVGIAPHSEGRFYYENGTFKLNDAIPDTAIDVGKELVVDVRNDNGSTLTNFTVVRYDTAVGGVPSVVRAQANTVDNADGVAVCTHDILVGQVGKATLSGVAGGDTSAWAVDDLLFVSATVAGELTNVEQEILSPVARVLVSDAVNGLIYINPEGVKNITAIGQVGGENETDTMTTTPASIIAYDNNTFQINTTVTLTGAAPYSASINPVSVGATGFYRVAFTAAITGTGNTIHNFELYVNGSPTGVLGKVDLNNNNIDAGTVAINAITQTKINNTDLIEVYGYTDTGSSTVLYESVVFNIERIGNA